MSSIRVILAEPHEIVREGVRVVLAADPRVRVVGEVATLAAVAATARRSCPDVLVVGHRLVQAASPGALGSLAATARPPAVVLMVALADDPHALPRRLVVRRLPESASASELLSAVVEGCSHHRLDARDPDGGEVRPPSPEGLTPRELQVLDCLARGLSNAEIARTLTLAVGTVKVHLARIMAKTGARSRVDLVAWAFRSGLVR